jgi:hypothetical protein
MGLLKYRDSTLASLPVDGPGLFTFILRASWLSRNAVLDPTPTGCPPSSLFPALGTDIMQDQYDIEPISGLWPVQYTSWSMSSHSRHT